MSYDDKTNTGVWRNALGSRRTARFGRRRELVPYARQEPPIIDIADTPPFASLSIDSGSRTPTPPPRPLRTAPARVSRVVTMVPSVTVVPSSLPGSPAADSDSDSDSHDSLDLYLSSDFGPAPESESESESDDGDDTHRPRVARKTVPGRFQHVRRVTEVVPASQPADESEPDSNDDDDDDEAEAEAEVGAGSGDYGDYDSPESPTRLSKGKGKRVVTRGPTTCDSDDGTNHGSCVVAHCLTHEEYAPNHQPEDRSYDLVRADTFSPCCPCCKCCGGGHRAFTHHEFMKYANAMLNAPEVVHRHCAICRRHDPLADFPDTVMVSKAYLARVAADAAAEAIENFDCGNCIALSKAITDGRARETALKDRLRRLARSAIADISCARDEADARIAAIKDIVHGKSKSKGKGAGGDGGGSAKRRRM